MAVWTTARRRVARRAAAAALAVVGAAGPSAGPAAAESFAAIYDVFLGGLRGGELHLSVERDGDAYAAAARLRAAGLAAWVFPGAATAQASGSWTQHVPAPARFAAEGDFSGKRQAVAIAFAPDGAMALSAEPPLRARSYDADPAALGGALDPLSAAVSALAPIPAAQACGRTIAVFDTRRRFDLALGPAKPEGGGLRCDGLFRRVAGYKAKHLARPPAPFTVWWRVTDGMATFERAQAPTPFGHAVARRRP